MVSNPNPVNELSSISKSRDNKKMVYGVSLNFSTLSNRFFNSANSAIFPFKKAGLSSKIVLNYKIVAFFYLFFYVGFLLRTFTNHRTAREGGRHLINSSLPFPPASRTLRH